MFGIGFGEMIVIGLLIVLAVGPDKLPTMVKTVAKTYRQFRRAAQDIRASTGIDDFLRDEELKELADLRKQKLLAMSKPVPGKPGAPAGTEKAMPPGKPGFEKGIAGKPGAYAEGEPAPIAKRAGLTHAQRIAEVPPEGVDVAEARLASIPETRAGADESAATIATPKERGAA
jgi:sec-independent protein translocase protein TatB